MSVMPNDMEKLVENFRAIQNRRSFQKDQRLIIYDCKTWPCSSLRFSWLNSSTPPDSTRNQITQKGLSAMTAN